jgi:hypothetical protein
MNKENGLCAAPEVGNAGTFASLGVESEWPQWRPQTMLAPQPCVRLRSLSRAYEIGIPALGSKSTKAILADLASIR